MCLSLHTFSTPAHGILESYRQWMARQDYSPVTLKGYADTMERIWRHLETIGVVDVSDLTPGLIPALETWLMDSFPHGPTRVAYINVLHSFGRFLMKTHAVLFDPFAALSMPRIQKKTRQVISLHEVRELLGSIVDPEERLQLTLLYCTGLRAGELASIKREDIDHERREIKVVGKGGHERRVYYPEALALELQRRIGCGTLFGRTSHEVSDLASFHLKRMGLPVTGAHTFRFAIATHLYEMGVHERSIQVMLGHNGLDTTYQYIRPQVDYLRGIHHQYHPFQRGFL